MHIGHQRVDLLLAFNPRAVVEIVEGMDELWTGVESLILRMPASEVGAEIVPCELHELQTIYRSGFARCPVLVEGFAQRGILERADIRRHLERTGTEQLAYRFGDLIVVVRTPVQ